MVSKIIKRTPTKSIKDCRSHRRRHRKKSPEKCLPAAASAAVIASINKSIHTCRRHLVKIFSKLARIGTPNRRKGFKILKKGAIEQDPDFDSDIRALVRCSRLPPSISQHKRTIFLDLDETLVHSRPDPPPEKFDFVVRPRIASEIMNFYVLKRPGVEDFLANLSKKFELVVFTAGLEEYASLVLDKIDKNRVISHRLYRDSCKEIDGKFVKDLAEMGRELENVVIVDDNPNAYIFQPENAIQVRPFVDDLEDKELEKLVKFFEGCDCFADMRDAVNHYVCNAHDGEEGVRAK